MTLEQQKAQLDNTQKAMAKYEDPTLSANIRAEIAKAYEPVLRSSTDATQRQMADFNQRFANIPYTGNIAGTGAESLTPQQKISAMGRELGVMGGRLASSSALTEALGGSLNTMQGNALQDMARAQQAAAQRYQQEFEKYRLAFDADQRAKDRAQQEKIARMNRAGRGGGSRGGGGIDLSKFAQALQGDVPDYVIQAFRQAQDPNTGDRSTRQDIAYRSLINWQSQVGGGDSDKGYEILSQNNPIINKYWDRWTAINKGYGY